MDGKPAYETTIGEAVDGVSCDDQFFLYQQNFSKHFTINYVIHFYLNLVIRIFKLQVTSLKESSTSKENGNEFKELASRDDLLVLNNYLSDKSYISGYVISQDDIIVAHLLKQQMNDATLKNLLEQTEFR